MSLKIYLITNFSVRKWPCFTSWPREFQAFLWATKHNTFFNDWVYSLAIWSLNETSSWGRGRGPRRKETCSKTPWVNIVERTLRKEGMHADRQRWYDSDAEWETRDKNTGWKKWHWNLSILANSGPHYELKKALKNANIYLKASCKDFWALWYSG